MVEAQNNNFEMNVSELKNYYYVSDIVVQEKVKLLMDFRVKQMNKNQYKLGYLRNRLLRNEHEYSRQNLLIMKRMK